MENPKPPVRVRNSVISQMDSVLFDQQEALKNRGSAAGYVLDGLTIAQLEKVRVFVTSFRASEIDITRGLQGDVFGTIEKFFMKRSDELRDMILKEGTGE